MRTTKFNLIVLFIISMFVLTNCEKSTEQMEVLSDLKSDEIVMSQASLRDLIATPENPGFTNLNFTLYDQAEYLAVSMQSTDFRLEVE